MEQNEIRVFENPEFGSVRTVIIDAEPWLAGKDVATILGYERATKAIVDRVDEEDRVKIDSKTQSQLGIELGQRGGYVINESGFYSLVLSSKLPKAKEFKHWVTSEVLPSIRKTGGYIAGQEQMTEIELVSNALLVAQRIMEERAARIAQLEAENAAALPKAKFYDDFVNPEACTSIRVTAKEIGVGERAMVKLLLNEGLCYRGNNPSKALLPYNNKNKGYFIVRDVPAKRSYNMVYQTRFTPKGKQMIRELCRKHGLLEEQEADTYFNNTPQVSKAG